VGKWHRGAGIEYYLPLFFDQTATLIDYLPRDSRIVLHGPVEASMRRFWNETASATPSCRAKLRSAPALAPGKLYLSAEELFLQLKAVCPPRAV